MALATLLPVPLLLLGPIRWPFAPARPRPAHFIRWAAPATVSLLSASPGTIQFSATNPILGSVSGSSPATVTWSSAGGNSQNTWTLTVQAGSSAFSGCPTVPVSAVTVSCSSAGVSGGGGTGACSGSFSLSTSPQTVAGGKEGADNQSYQVSILYTLAESWRYIASVSQCNLTLTYTVNAP